MGGGRGSARTTTALLLGGVGVGLLWAYTPTLEGLVRRWAFEPQASHGAIVPFFALGVLWLRRDRLEGVVVQPTWWGLGLVALGGLCRLFAAFLALDWFDGFSLLPTLAGLGLLVYGWGAMRWLLPSLVVLFFMLPLPFTVEAAISAPLQRFATHASAYLLVTLGLPVVSEGNILMMQDTRIGVLEACNGLGMMSAFLALCLTAGMVVRRPWWHKLVLCASAVPVAMLMNLLRITATGLVTWFAGPLPGVVFHDRAGWFMMPLAVLLVWLEMQLLSNLFVPVPVVSSPMPTPVAPKPMAAHALPSPAPAAASSDGHRSWLA